MVTCLTIIACCCFIFAFSRSPNDEYKHIAEAQYSYALELYRYSSWEKLLNHIQISIPDNLIIMEESKIYWYPNYLADFLYCAQKDGNNNFSISIDGSANGTSKNFFGFSLNLSSPNSSWVILLDDSLAGFKISRNARQLASSFKKLLPMLGRSTTLMVNYKIVWQYI